LDSSERELFQESLGPFSAPLLSSPNLSRLRQGGAFSSFRARARALDFRASLASSEQAARRSEKKKKARKKKKKKKKKRRKRRKRRRSEKRSAATPLREVYFANKTGPVPCLLKQ